MPDVSVIVPVFNAIDYLDDRLRALSGFLDAHCPDYELVLVDDGSTDGSADAAASLDLARCRLLRLPRNTGKFAAIADGVRHSRGTCIVFTDADVPYDPSAIPYMAELVLRQGFHLAIGDRTLPESGGLEKAGRLRGIASRLFTGFIRVFVTGGLHDTQCGLKAVRGDIARALFPLLSEKRFSGDVELLYIALKYNLAVRRVPVRLQYQGPSSVRLLRDGAAMLLAGLRLRRRHRRGAYHSDALMRLARQDYEPTRTAPSPPGQALHGERA